MIGPRAMGKSMYSLPSTSQTWLPCPRAKKTGDAPWTSWLGPLLNVCEHEGISRSAFALRERERFSCSGLLDFVRPRELVTGILTDMGAPRLAISRTDPATPRAAC